MDNIIANVIQEHESKNELIAKLIRANGYNPDTKVGESTVFNIVEGHILGAFDEIDEYQEEEHEEEHEEEDTGE